MDHHQVPGFCASRRAELLLSYYVFPEASARLGRDKKAGVRQASPGERRVGPASLGLFLFVHLSGYSEGHPLTLTPSSSSSIPQEGDETGSGRPRGPLDVWGVGGNVATTGVYPQEEGLSEA